jgi:hypothetical protein
VYHYRRKSATPSFIAQVERTKSHKKQHLGIFLDPKLAAAAYAAHIMQRDKPEAYAKIVAQRQGMANAGGEEAEEQEAEAEEEEEKEEEEEEEEAFLATPSAAATAATATAATTQPPEGAATVPPPAGAAIAPPAGKEKGQVGQLLQQELQLRQRLEEEEEEAKEGKRSAQKRGNKGEGEHRPSLQLLPSGYACTHPNPYLDNMAKGLRELRRGAEQAARLHSHTQAPLQKDSEDIRNGGNGKGGDKERPCLPSTQTATPPPEPQVLTGWYLMAVPTHRRPSGCELPIAVQGMTYVLCQCGDL